MSETKTETQVLHVGWLRRHLQKLPSDAPVYLDGSTLVCGDKRFTFCNGRTGYIHRTIRDYMAGHDYECPDLDTFLGEYKAVIDDFLINGTTSVLDACIRLHRAGGTLDKPELPAGLKGTSTPTASMLMELYAEEMEAYDLAIQHASHYKNGKLVKR